MWRNRTKAKNEKLSRDPHMQFQFLEMPCDCVRENRESMQKIRCMCWLCRRRRVIICVRQKMHYGAHFFVFLFASSFCICTSSPVQLSTLLCTHSHSRRTALPPPPPSMANVQCGKGSMRHSFRLDILGLLCRLRLCLSGQDAVRLIRETKQKTL